jgi:outer membrane immunogenic protein
MKSLTRFLIVFCACNALALISFAGPEPIRDYKESKEVAPPVPPPCDWSGFYFGIHVGGQFGHSEDFDEDYNIGSGDPGKAWGYSESGFVAGGQVGYNWQFHHFVVGVESDIGYMNMDGSGVEPASINRAGGDTRGESDSDFYVTVRGRVGFAQDCWLFYVTGGVIGVNYDTRVVDDCFTGDCGGGTIDAHKQEFNWGPTVGGGIERMLGRHWSIKLEYLFYTLDNQGFDGISTSHFALASTSLATTPDAIQGKSTDTNHFSGETEGHIVRVGLNFRF